MKNKYIKCYSRKDKQTPKKLEKRKADLSLSNGNFSIDTSLNKVFARKEKRKKNNESFKENRRPRATYVSKPAGVKNSSFVCSNARKETKISSVFDDWELSEDSPFSKLAKSVRKDKRLKFVNLSNFPSPTYGQEDKFLSSSSGCLTNSGNFSAQLSSTPTRISPQTGATHGTPNHLVAQNIPLGSGSSSIPASLSARKCWALNNSLRKSDSHQGSDPRFAQPLAENILLVARTTNANPSSVVPVSLSFRNFSRENDQREISNHGSGPGFFQPSSRNILSCSRTSDTQISAAGPVLLPLGVSSRKSDWGETPKDESAPYVQTKRRGKNVFLEGSPSPIIKCPAQPNWRPSQEICDLNDSADIINSTPIRPLPVRKWSKDFKKRRQAILLPLPPLSKTSSSSIEISSSKSVSKTSSSIEISSSKSGLESKEGESESSRCESNIFKSICAISSWNGILNACNQSSAISFTDYLYQRHLVSIDKVGEGVFSEVFGCLDEEGVRTVWKIQPFEGDLIINGEEQKKSDEILTEIQITKCLSNLRHGKDFVTDSFVESLDFKCVRGPYPDLLLELWNEYDDRKGSENDCPSVFSEEQLLLVTELEYAGICLEDFQFTLSSQTLSVFFQVAHALAIGEMAVEFEHRDLHWGNIMICRTSAKYISFKVKEGRRVIETKGVLAKIVDFTLSRASLNGQPVYADLSLNPDIFESTGEYQFEIYRLMKKHTENVWSKYTPYTNILWLHYLVLQMCAAVKYRNKTSKVHKQCLKILKDISTSILSYSSATDFVTNQVFYEYVSTERDSSNLSGLR